MAKAREPVVEIKDVPTEADIKRGDEVLKWMLQTKPKPHKEMTVKVKKSSGNTSAR